MPTSMEKRARVPKLRFPEFREAEGWAAPMLGSIGSFTGGGTPSRDNTSYWIGSNPWVSSSDIPEDGVQEIFISRYISDEAIQETATKIVPANSILLVSRVGVGKLAIIREPICTSQDFTNFTPVQDNLVFLAYCIKSLKSRLLTFNQGMAIKGFTKNDVSSLEIPLPSLVEQQKIADCLTSLDKRITLEAQKLDTLKTHKKGLMQQLFPKVAGASSSRGFETREQDAPPTLVPKLRFPEFRDTGKWEETLIDDFGQVVTGNTPSTVRPEFYGGGIPFVSPADISDLRFVNETKITLTTRGFDETRPIKANSVLFVCIGSTIGKVTQNVQDCATNQQINSVIPNTTHSSGFVYYTLSLNAERIANLAGRQAVPIINKTQFSSIRLPVPKLREQKRIADCLASLDDLITAQTQKLTALKTHKKGLMQQLFPVLDEAQA